jgi:hypothetical protein
MVRVFDYCFDGISCRLAEPSEIATLVASYTLCLSVAEKKSQSQSRETRHRDPATSAAWKAKKRKPARAERLATLVWRPEYAAGRLAILARRPVALAGRLATLAGRLVPLGGQDGCACRSPSCDRSQSCSKTS